MPHAPALVVRSWTTWRGLGCRQCRRRRDVAGGSEAKVVARRRRQSIHVSVRYDQEDGEGGGGRFEQRDRNRGGGGAEAAFNPPSSTALTYFFNVLSLFLLAPLLSTTLVSYLISCRVRNPTLAPRSHIDSVFCPRGGVMLASFYLEISFYHHGYRDGRGNDVNTHSCKDVIRYFFRWRKMSLPRHHRHFEDFSHATSFCCSSVLLCFAHHPIDSPSPPLVFFFLMLLSTHSYRVAPPAKRYQLPRSTQRI